MISQDLESLLRVNHAHPHTVLGMHLDKKDAICGLRVTAYLREVKSCEVVDLSRKPNKYYPMKKLNEDSLFQAFIPNRKKPFPYKFKVTNFSGNTFEIYDPYSFLPSLSDQDLYLFNEGTHHQIYKKLGAHPRIVNNVKGVSFAVWAPNAARVSIVADFNHWDGRYHLMRTLGCSGVWELFIPDVHPPFNYKFEIFTKNGKLFNKIDPYATCFEGPPNNASVCYDLDGYEWQDEYWQREKRLKNWNEEPISVYEVHLGSWRRIVEENRRQLTYEEHAQQLATYVKKLNFTHVELLPVAEHPYEGSWGYQTTGFFAPTSRFGSPKDFMLLVDTFHQHNIGVILDWVPAHFPKDDFALRHFDGTALYEHEDPRQGEHPDWGTHIFNYGRKEVSNFLLGSALSWLERYHIDGLRVDAVASMLYLDYSRSHGDWIPNRYGGRENIEALEFIRTFNDLVHQYYPGTLTIAEESTSFAGITKPTSEYGLGFDFKWNMGWMHDNLKYQSYDPIYRKYHHNNLTFGMLYQYSESFITPISHDEVVHGKASLIYKMPSWDIPQKAQNLRAFLAYMWAWPGKKLLFMGAEFAQTSEWNHNQSLDWHLLQYDEHSGVQTLIKDLNQWYSNFPSLAKYDQVQEGFQWVNPDDGENSVVAFLRKGTKNEETFLIVSNFTPVPRESYFLGVPYLGFWKEWLNTNSQIYAGNDSGNLGGLHALESPSGLYPFSLKTYLPGLTTLIFKYES